MHGRKETHYLGQRLWSDRLLWVTHQQRLFPPPEFEGNSQPLRFVQPLRFDAEANCFRYAPPPRATVPPKWNFEFANAACKATIRQGGKASLRE